MTLQEFIKRHGKNGNEQTMWDSVKAISDFTEDMRYYDEPRYKDLIKELYGIMCGEHYNEEFAEEQIKKMFFVDSRGVRHAAPYWTEEQMSEAYNKVKGLIPHCYTEHDFWVALNMMKSDYGNLVESWFPDNADEKIIELTVNYFNDPDAPNCETKIWSYFN